MKENTKNNLVGFASILFIIGNPLFWIFGLVVLFLIGFIFALIAPYLVGFVSFMLMVYTNVIEAWFIFVPLAGSIVLLYGFYKNAESAPKRRF